MTSRVCKLLLRKTMRDGIVDSASFWNDLFEKKDATLWDRVKQHLEAKFGEESSVAPLLDQVDCSAVQRRVREMMGGELDAPKVKSFFFVSFYEGFCAFRAACSDWRAAAAAYLRALESVPCDVVVLNNLSIVLKNEKQFFLAERCLFHALRLANNNPVTLFNYGALKYAERQYSEALKLFCEAEQVVGAYTSESLSYSIVQCLIRLRQWDEAQAKLSSMIHSDEAKHSELRLLLESEREQQSSKAVAQSTTFVDTMLDEDSCDERDAASGSGSEWSGDEYKSRNRQKKCSSPSSESEEQSY